MSVEVPAPLPASDLHLSVDTLPDRIPGLETEKTASSLVLRRHTFPRLEQPLWCPVDPDVVEFVLIVDGSGHIERKMGEEWERGTFAPGDLFIHPGPAGPQAWCGDPNTHLRAYLSLDLLRRTETDTSHDSDRTRVIPRFLTDDPLIATLLRAAWTVLGTNKPTETLYGDHVARTLALQVLRAHSTTVPPEAGAEEGGLGAAQLQRVKNYIEAHLDEDICLGDLAEQAEMSEYHFSRQFKNEEDIPPYRYVVRRRMEKAKTLLADTDRSIAQIAFAVGYDSQSAFTTRFRKYTGTTPGRFR